MWQKILVFTFLISFTLLGNGCSNHSSNETKGGLENLEEAASDVNRLKKFSFDKLDEDLEVVTLKDEYQHTIEYSRNKLDYARQGLFLRKDSIGRLLEAANYLNDTLHGSRILFYPETETKQIVEHYDHGQFHGNFQAYFPSGKLEQEGNYIHNVMDSTWVRYYETGQLKEEVMFRDNDENGPFTEYYANGNLKAEGFFKDGDNEHGLLKLYDEEGVLVKTMDCKNGICKTIWKKEDIQ